MKLSNAVSKLNANGYEVKTDALNRHFGIKGNKQIRFELAAFGESIEDIYYTEGLSKWKKAYNLTQALRKLGDVSDSPRRAEPVGSGKTTRRTLIRRFAEEKTLNSAQLSSLGIKTFRQVSEIFEDVFEPVYRSSRRYSHSKNAKQRQLNNRKTELWTALIQNFLLQPDALPLRLVEITTKVPGYEDARDTYGSRLRTDVRTRAPVFARSSEEARTIVQSIMGDLATVGSIEIIAIAPQEEALEIYRTEFDASGRKEEERNFANSQNRLREMERNLEIAKRDVELGQKKLELVSFIENFSTMATISSQSGDIAGISLS